MFQIKRDMEASGYTKLAATLALKELTTKGFLAYGEKRDMTGDYYTGYWLTDKGWQWVIANKKRFVLKKADGSEDDDIPF